MKRLIHIPLVGSDPLLYQEPRETQAFYSHLDLLPTLAELAGAPELALRAGAALANIVPVLRAIPPRACRIPLSLLTTTCLVCRLVPPVPICARCARATGSCVLFRHRRQRDRITASSTISRRSPADDQPAPRHRLVGRGGQLRVGAPALDIDAEAGECRQSAVVSLPWPYAARGGDEATQTRNSESGSPIL